MADSLRGTRTTTSSSTRRSALHLHGQSQLGIELVPDLGVVQPRDGVIQIPQELVELPLRHAHAQLRGRCAQARAPQRQGWRPGPRRRIARTRSVTRRSMP